jgi:hypothetical protein
VVTNQVGGELYLAIQNKLLPGGLKMKRNIAIGRFGWIVTAIVTIGLSTSRAQTITHVEFDLPSLNYDVIYLGDFIDISSNKLAKNIPNFSGTILATGSGTGDGQIILDATAQIMLKGDPSPSILATATTKPFKIPLVNGNGSRTISANDLAGGVTDIDIAQSYENTTFRQRIEDYAKSIPTAPVGQYTLQLTAYSVVSGVKGAPVGSTQKIITVRNASPDEVQVNLIDPQPGSVVSTTLPTFSWTSPNPDVTLYVYEKLPIYQSLQEAVNGIPYLKQEVNGPQTFTYPANAARRLEQNKSYVWFVEAAVTTNRQTIQKRSELRLFRIQLDNREGQEVSDMMNSFGSSAAGTFSTLQSIGWIPTGPITLDGKPVTLDDLKALVAKLAAQNIQVNVRVE